MTSSARIYIGSINFDLTEADLRSVFEPYGTIKSCILLVRFERTLVCDCSQRTVNR